MAVVQEPPAGATHRTTSTCAESKTRNDARGDVSVRGNTGRRALAGTGAHAAHPARRGALSRWLACVAILVLPLTARLAHAQKYYVQVSGEDALSPVYNQDLATMDVRYWVVYCYKRGTQAGIESNRWGTISGKSADEVMSEWRTNRADEEKAERGSSYRSTLTYTNCLGPIAVVSRSKSRTGVSEVEFGGSEPGRSAWVSQATSLVDQWKSQVQDAALSAIRRAEETPFSGMGSVLGEYKDQLSQAQERARLLQGLLNNVSAGGKATTSQIEHATNDLRTSVNWLNTHTPALDATVTKARADARTRAQEQERERRRQEAERERAKQRVMDNLRAAQEQNDRSAAATQEAIQNFGNTIQDIQDEHARDRARREANLREQQRQRDEAANAVFDAAEASRVDSADEQEMARQAESHAQDRMSAWRGQQEQAAKDSVQKDSVRKKSTRKAKKPEYR